MKCATLESSALLTGVANMLSLYGLDSTDAAIAKGMEAPYLLLLEDGGYVAGTDLFRPQYVNHYLHPRGFHMQEHRIPQAEVGAFLRKQRTALFTMNVSPDARWMVVYSGYADRKYSFIPLRKRLSFEPDTLSFTAAALKNRLDDTVTLYTLEECAPVPVDFIALLVRTLESIQACRKELAACPARVSQADFEALERRLFRPLMQRMNATVDLIGDSMLSSEYRLMFHDYRHMLIRDYSREVILRGRLPLESAGICLQYLHEDILDRLFELGADDELLEKYAPFSQN